MQSIPAVACKPTVLQTHGFLKIGLQTPGFPGKTGGSTPEKYGGGEGVIGAGGTIAPYESCLV